MFLAPGKELPQWHQVANIKTRQQNSEKQQQKQHVA
jgi:hypothetical protein